MKAMDSSVSQGRHLDQKLLAESTPVLEGGCFKLLPLLVASVPGSGLLQTGLGQGAFVIFMAAKHLFFFLKPRSIQSERKWEPHGKFSPFQYVLPFYVLVRPLLQMMAENIIVE